MFRGATCDCDHWEVNQHLPPAQRWSLDIDRVRNAVNLTNRPPEFDAALTQFGVEFVKREDVVEPPVQMESMGFA